MENNTNIVYKTEKTINIVTTVAFLIGVKEDFFTHTQLARDLVEELKQNENAVIMRSLCNIRSTLMLNFDYTERNIVYELKNLDRLEYYEKDIKILRGHNIEIIKVNYKTNNYILDLNNLITARIGNLQGLFPDWVNWSYIKDLFIMPKGNRLDAIKAESYKYSANRNVYPFKRYINWNPEENGNILISDAKFLKVLYAQHFDTFDDKSKVFDANDTIKTNIYDFINNSEEVIIAVDCENSDVFKLASTLKQLNEDELSKISKILLYDDIHTTKAWQYLGIFTSIPVERHLVERIKDDKSLVDMKMCADIAALHYRDKVNSYILVSSDSDYWGLISSMPNANFLVMIEYEKCGPDIKNALTKNGTYYCSVDDFCTANIQGFKNSLLRKELNERVKSISIDTKAILEDIYLTLRLDADTAERHNFYNKYIKEMKLEIDKDGIMRIVIPS